MKNPFVRIGVALFAAAGMAACSDSAQSPTSPSAAMGGSTTAAADGSTLKATAPVALSPTGGARVDSRRPTLSWSESVGRHAGVSPRYQVQVSLGATVVYDWVVDGTSHQVGADSEFDQEYSWRVRATQEGAFGPWSTPATFVSPVQAALLGGAGGSGFRAPDPPPGSRLPLPNMYHVVIDVANNFPGAWRNSCQEHGGSWEAMDRIVDGMRAVDLRWGYNGKRGNVNDPSLDVVDYHWGAGPSQGSTQVYIIDIMFQHCGSNPAPAWIDQTGVTAEQGAIGRWTFPRPGRVVN